jgi:hypothetical protein
MELEECYIGFEVLTAVVMKVTIFQDIAPFSRYMNRRFGGTSVQNDMALCLRIWQL